MPLPVMSCGGTTSHLHPPGILNVGRSRAQAAQKTSPHALPVALGSSGPSSTTTAPHHSLHHNHHGGITASSTLLCPGDYPLALLRHCCSVLSPPQTTEPPAAANTDLQGRLGSAAPELHHPTACSQRGLAWRSSYPNSSPEVRKKSTKSCKISQLHFPPAHPLLQLKVSLPCSSMPPNRSFSWVFICPWQNLSGFGVGLKAHGGKRVRAALWISPGLMLPEGSQAEWGESFPRAAS